MAVATQWNTTKPAMGNQVSSDIPDIEENFEEIQRILECITNGTLGTTDSDAYAVDTLAAGTVFAATTVMLFGQSAAPTGWTKKTDWQDQSMIVYTTGNVAQGGAVDAKAAHQHAAFTLDTTRIPAHSHQINSGGAGSGSSAPFGYNFADYDATELTGGGGSHQHTANSAPYYCSVIAATKD